jgi:dTDP-4-dehydrorhamnose 3,5-epimerase-like enzyme
MPSEVSPRIPGVRVFEVVRNEDERGVFMKPVAHSFVGERKASFGEVYVIQAPPGCVRGSHLHRESIEWFCVISGRALLVLERDGIRDEIVLDGDFPRTVEIPPGVAHAIKGIGADPMTLVVYWDRAYDPAATDTFPQRVSI